MYIFICNLIVYAPEIYNMNNLFKRHSAHVFDWSIDELGSTTQTA